MGLRLQLPSLGATFFLDTHIALMAVLLYAALMLRLGLRHAADAMQAVAGTSGDGDVGGAGAEAPGTSGGGRDKGVTSKNRGGTQSYTHKEAAKDGGDKLKGE